MQARHAGVGWMGLAMGLGGARSGGRGENIASLSCGLDLRRRFCWWQTERRQRGCSVGERS